jgi:UDP:flavonoid glycosyltransferase YjiC (YdhE family)
VKEGDVGGIIGLGGLGINGARFAVLAGATVDGVDTNEAVFENAKALGVTETFTDAAQLAQFHRMSSSTSPASAPPPPERLNVVKPAGTVDQVGLGRTQATISTNDLILKTVTLRGSLGGSQDDLKAVLQLISDGEFSPIVEQISFAGALPLLQQPADDRLPVIAVGIGPLAQLSVDTPLANSRMPMASGPLARMRNRLLNAAAYRVFFARAQRLAERLLVEAGGQKPSGFILDFSRLPDRYLQLGPREFEYERRDLSGNLRFVGALSPARSPGIEATLPTWWDELADGRPVVHVTQGTLDNHDPGMVIRPTIDALAGLDIHVVVSTGRAPVETVGPLPPNARIAEFLPYDRLLPLCDVMVTNGGYGGTMAALSAGVALVVAGAAEDKPEVAARVDYFGVGIDLRTGRPHPRQLRDAVRRILGDASFRERAQAMRTSIAGYDTFANIRNEIDATLKERHRPDTTAAVQQVPPIEKQP